MSSQWAGLRIVDTDRVRDKIIRARENACPLFMLIIATKPCYVKLSPLVKLAAQQGSPLIIIDTGHHFDDDLTGAGRDFDIGKDIDVFMDIRGTMLGRTAELSSKCETLAEFLSHLGASLETTSPIVSGDTSTSATFPLFWYLHTGARCMHIEAGLRSRSPFATQDPTFSEVRRQGLADWLLVPDEPFPEGVDTRVTSVVSRRLYAPLENNRAELLREGYDGRNIILTGSLSADAVDAVCGSSEATRPGNPNHIRVDVHRRENMTPPRLEAIIGAVEALAGNGFSVSFVMTNQIKGAFGRAEGGGLRARLDRANVQCDAITPSYAVFLRGLAAGRYGMMLTDSGGLQEETAILGIPCGILRYSTDRPETVLSFGSAILAPPASREVVLDTIEWYLQQPVNRNTRPYGHGVSRLILADLAAHVGAVEKPFRGRKIV